MAIVHFQDLIVWQKAMELTKLVYENTRCFPQDERFGLVAQMRRSAISIPSNIAEGQARDTDRDFGRFLKVANGSRQELLTQILIAHSMNYLTDEDLTKLQSLCDEVGKLTNGLLSKLNTTS